MSIENILELDEAKNIISSHSLSLFSCNVRSLNAHSSALLQLIEDLGSPKVLALNELWHANDSALLIPSYNRVVKLRENKRGGGVGIWWSNECQSYPCAELDALQLNEIEMISSIILHGTKKMLVCSIYRPPDSNLNKSLQELATILDTAKNVKIKFFLVGDFNIDILKDNSAVQKYLDLLQMYHCIQLVQNPTRIGIHRLSILDHVIVEDTTKASSFSINSTVADHLPTITLIGNNQKQVHLSSEKQTVRKSLNLDLLSSKLSSVCWNVWQEKRESLNADELFSSFQRLLSKFMNESYECKKVRVHKYHPRTPWITQDTIDIKKNVDRARKKYLRTQSIFQFIKFNNLQKLYKSRLKANKNTYFLNQLKLAASDSKKIWQLINKAIGRNPKNSGKVSVPKLKIGDKIVEDPLTICEGFNYFFKNAALDIASKIPKSKVSFQDFLTLNSKAIESLSLDHVSEKEVLRTIKSLKAKASCGYDNISNKTLKHIAPHIIIPLTTCINKTISEGKFPSSLKVSKVIPLFKGGSDDTLCTNYRPISQLSSLSKIFEKIIFNQANKFLVSNNILHPLQFGFREGHATSDAIFATVTELETCRNQNLFSIILSLDLKKAFDVVNNEKILPAKLQHYFKDEKTCNLITSFFQNRKQYVQMNDITSSVTNNHNISVCQGSSSGPQCFSIFINDLPNATNMLTILFADDTNCIISGKDLSLLEKEVNKELVSIKNFMESNQLALNTSKTTFMVVSPANNKPKEKVTLKIGKDTIQESDEISFLGVLIDKNMKFKGHFNKVHKKVQNGVNAISMARKTLNFKAKFMIYNSLVHSHLSYCCLSWLPKLNQNQIKTLATLQKRALRAIFNTHHLTHTTPLFNLSHITRVEDLAEAESLKMLYKYKNDLLPSGTCQIIKKFTESSLSQTRSQNSQNTLNVKGLMKNDTLYEAVKFWNQSNIEIKTNTYKMISVKQRIKKHLRDRYKNCDNERCISCFKTNSTALEEYMKC